MVATIKLQELFHVALSYSDLTCPKMQIKCINIQFGNHDNSVDTAQYQGKKPLLPFAASEVLETYISDWRRLSALNVDCKAVYEVSLNVQDKNLSYHPGDTIGIIPQNKKSEVDLIINHLELSKIADCVYSITVDSTDKLSKVPDYIPVKSTLRHLLTHCLDLRCLVKKHLLIPLAQHTKDENEKKVLEFLSSSEGSTAYREYVLEKKLCVLDIFQMLPSCKPSIGVLLAYLSRLLPRPYSIVNSKLKEPDVIKICFSVMDIGNARKGLVTEWLEDTITAGIEGRLNNLTLNGNSANIVKFYMRKNFNGFNPPQRYETPMILIGPGTGSAPFIGFLQEREVLKNTNSDTTLKFGDVCLFFGCRKPELDYIYKDEVEEFVAKNVLTKLCTAFSRVENSDEKYVQDAILQNSCYVTKLIMEGASIYVCGEQKTMTLQVQQAIENCLVKHDAKDQREAASFVSQMKKDRLYNIDLWN